jgi:hypothetical protein
LVSDLKILLAIGGWNHGSGPFTAMVSNQSNIDQFAANSLTFLRNNGFDGLDHTTSGTGTAYPSGAPEFTPGFLVRFVLLVL